VSKKQNVGRGHNMANNVKLTPEYWDCECTANYIHLKSQETVCLRCRQMEGEMPDSIATEVATYLSMQLATVTDCGDEETASFIHWTSEMSRTSQDMVNSFMTWAARNKYACIDDLPWEQENG
jgi:hypothetical protein